MSDGLIRPPGDVAPPSREWSKTVSDLIDKAAKAAVRGSDLGDRPPPFYDPLEGLDAVTPPPVTWSALSGTLRSLTNLSDEERWKIADEKRLDPLEGPGGSRLFGQDEYCEWSVARNERGEITRVTFTSEVGEWFDHMAENDRRALLSTYREMFGPEVEEEDLFSGDSY
ncbi:MAG TPA: hypothetical protein VFW48_06170, partial [Solirubrobacterales bacterium]|nr:hypothetical protein [Solirubrobacterales bacterium]